MKRVPLLAFLPFLLAANYYVDPDCKKASGDGTSPACSSTTKHNPFKTLSAGISALSAGDTLNVYGVHGPHDGGNCPGNQRGAYSEVMSSGDPSYVQAVLLVANKNWGMDTFIQPMGYTTLGARTQQRVLIETTESVTWHGCGQPVNGVCKAPCDLVPGGFCNEVWWISTDAGNHASGGNGINGGPVAELDNGQPTFCAGGLVSSHACGIACSTDAQCFANMTNAHPTYNPLRCHSETYRPCTVATAAIDCHGGDACDVTIPEKDHYWLDGSPPRLFVRWGTMLPVYSDGSSPKVSMTSNGATPIALFNSRHVIVRGFIGLMGHMAALARIAGTCDTTCALRDNVFIHADQGAGSGGDYGVHLLRANGATVDWNEIAYTGAETMHLDARSGGASNYQITNNWIHNTGDQSVANVESTAQGITIGDENSSDHQDYTGSVIEGNLFSDIKCREDLGGSDNHGCFGLQMEGSSHLTIRNNIFLRTGNGSCIRAEPGAGNGGFPKLDDVYSNLCLEYVSNGFLLGEHAQFNVFNNTFSGRRGSGPAIKNEGTAGNGGPPIFKNNLLLDYGTGPHLLIDWTPDAPVASVQNNQLWAPNAKAGSSIARIGGSFFTPPGGPTPWGPSGDVDGDGRADSNRYGDPGLSATDASAGEFRLPPWSLAIDAGTTIGIPTRGTINNPLAILHGLPDYSAPITGTLSSAVDIGAWEQPLEHGNAESGSMGTGNNAGKWSIEATGCNCPLPQIGSPDPASRPQASHGIRVFQFGSPGACLESLPAVTPCFGMYYDLSNLVVGRPTQISFDYYVKGPGPVDCVDDGSGTCWAVKVQLDPSTFVCHVKAFAPGSWNHAVCTFTPTSASHRIRLGVGSVFSEGVTSILVDNTELR